MEKQKISSAQRRNIDGLGGLRGIAILAIVLYHMYPQQIKGGFLGVTLFFIISGYLIAYTSEWNLRGKGFFIPAFYGKRIAKIYPALVIVVGLSTLVLKLGIGYPMKNIWEEIASIVLGYNNWWQISQNASYFTKVTGSSPFTHLWYLGVEIQFYLVWPFIFYLYLVLSQRGKRGRGIAFLMALAIASLVLQIALCAPGVDVTRVYYGTDTRIYAVLFGCVMGFLGADQEQKKRRRKPENAGLIFAVCLILACVLFYITDGQELITYWVLLPAACFLFIIMVQVAENPATNIGKRLDHSPFGWLGRYSYEIYLSQYPISFIFGLITKGSYTLATVGLEIITILAVSVVLNLFLGAIQKKADPKRYLKVVAASMALLIGMGVVFSTGRFDTESDEAALQQELAENSSMLENQETASSESPSSDTATVPDTGDQGDGNADTGTDGKTDGNSDGNADTGTDGKTDKNADGNSDPGSGEDSAATDDEDTEYTSSHSIFFLGDSVMLGAARAIKKQIPDCRVDAKESRQMWDASDELKDIKDSDGLGDCVVIGLGTNGTFRKQVGEDVLDAIGDKPLFLITCYGKYLTWQESANKMIRGMQKKHDNVKIIDWASYAEGHSSWFYKDGIHLKEKGQKAYAKFIKEQINSQM